MLIHFDSKRVLFIDVDIVKRSGIEAMIYYVDGKLLEAKECLVRTKVRFILFLSRFLKGPKTRY
jgi:hypothetical protein